MPATTDFASITAHIGNDYGRVRVGIGRPGAKHLVSGYVLHDFAKADADWLEPLLDAIAGCRGSIGRRRRAALSRRGCTRHQQARPRQAGH